MKEKKLDFIEVKNSYYAKESIKRIKRQAEKISEKCMSDKGFVFKMSRIH